MFLSESKNEFQFKTYQHNANPISGFSGFQMSEAVILVAISSKSLKSVRKQSFLSKVAETGFRPPPKPAPRKC